MSVINFWASLLWIEGSRRLCELWLLNNGGNRLGLSQEVCFIDVIDSNRRVVVNLAFILPSESGASLDIRTERLEVAIIWGRSWLYLPLLLNEWLADEGVWRLVSN
jgi:hypothetical protein